MKPTTVAKIQEQRKLDAVSTVAELELLLSEPTERAIESVARCDGDIMLLGAGGKMGPTLARMARRAADCAGVRRRVIAVSRFSSAGSRTWLESNGVETIACDLLDPEQLRQLPDVRNLIFMAGMKFGTSGNEAEMWGMNCHLPALICQTFRNSRIVAFSTGNVYGLTPVERGGSRESDAPRPTGEYAMACLGRERIFEYFSTHLGIPVFLLRLNYACELRYGVLVDLARKVWLGEPIDLAMGHFNVIWQADANAAALCALEKVSSPPLTLNLTGPEQLSVRQVCDELGRRFNKPVSFCGEEGVDALLSNGKLGHTLFGAPRYQAAELIQAVAAWIQRGGEWLGKPTHFESRDGRF
jgi:nucleoside-diphosphate-sugar epimerase